MRGENLGFFSKVNSTASKEEEQKKGEGEVASLGQRPVNEGKQGEEGRRSTLPLFDGDHEHRQR